MQRGEPACSKRLDPLPVRTESETVTRVAMFCYFFVGCRYRTVRIGLFGSPKTQLVIIVQMCMSGIFPRSVWLQKKEKK